MGTFHSSRAKVISNDKLADGIFRLKLFCPEIASSCRPGQFVHIQCGTGRDFILRRPFSVHRQDGGGAFEILFQVIGKGTKVLSRAQPREEISVVGPIGHGFEIEKSVRNVMVVSGGIGVAPLIFLIDELLSEKKRVCTLMGAASKDKLLYAIDLKRLVRNLLVATDDGSQGQKGLVTDLMPQAIEEFKPERVYACGPQGMLFQVASICKEYGRSAQVGLERLMGCGIGACLSCVCKTVENEKTSLKRVCVDGPVFDAESIVWQDLEQPTQGVNSHT
jgi:dihydroorotate dehydrogenase electron transfer subunit